MSRTGTLRRFVLPDLGEGLTEAEVVAWRVVPGDEVALNQVLVEVETEKALVELPSPFAGRVVDLLANEGDTVSVGSALISIEVARVGTVPGAETAQRGRHHETSEHEDEDAEYVPTLVGYGPSNPPPSRRRTRRAHGPRTRPSDRTQSGVPARPLAAPPVRFMARQHGIDLRQVTGNGPDGVITREDLEAHITTPSRREGDERESREPVRGVRKRMAEAMVASVVAAPQASVFLTVDATRTMQLVTRLRRNRRFEGLAVTPLAVVARAVVLALAEHPALNTSWNDGSADASQDDGTAEIVTKHYVNLGIAVAGPRGLLVPTIREAQKHNFRQLVAALGTLTARARTDRCTPEELRDGTFTITNVGVFGVDAGVPILNPGEAGILALGAVQGRPWEHHGDIALRDVVTLVLTFDHRLVDGQEAARFLGAVGEIVAEPSHLLAFG